MEKAIINIKTWLTQENMRVAEMEDNENAFHLEVMPETDDRDLPIDIIGSKETDEKILVCWIWGIFEEDRNTLKMIDSKVKESFASETKLEFQLMNLQIDFIKSIEDLQAIFSGIDIFIDKLTKEILLEVIHKLKQAHEFTSKKFAKDFSLPDEFDPSSHV